MNTLLVEDDKHLVKIYQTELELLGARVRVATDGKQALIMAREELPELILMDVILPEKIGLTVLKELKEDARTKSIPVVIVTNFDQGDNPKKAIELGAAKFLSKQKYSPQEIAKEALSVLP